MGTQRKRKRRRKRPTIQCDWQLFLFIGYYCLSLYTFIVLWLHHSTKIISHKAYASIFHTHACNFLPTKTLTFVNYFSKISISHTHAYFLAIGMLFEIYTNCLIAFGWLVMYNFKIFIVNHSVVIRRLTETLVGTLCIWKLLYKVLK